MSEARLLKARYREGLRERRKFVRYSFLPTKDKYGPDRHPSYRRLGAGLIEKLASQSWDALKVRSGRKEPHGTLFSARGSTYNEAKAKSFAKLDHLILVCGHYEGIDERVNKYVDELVSVGDYILTGGEIPAMAVSDSVIRLLDGAIASESLVDESFNQPLLEYPQYTEPADYEGDKVPDILYTGDHKAIDKWRRKQSLALTRKYRPDLFKKLELTKQDRKLLEELDEGETPKWETDALEKGKKFIKK